MQTIIDQVTEVMKSYKTLTGIDINDGSGKAVKLDDLFQKFIKAHFKDTEAHGKKWMTQSIVYAETEYLKEIKKLKAMATELSRQESQKDITKKKAYIKQVKDKRQVLEKAAQPIKTKLNTIRTQLEKMEADVLAVEKKVAAAATVSAKSKARKDAKWNTIKDALLDKRKELVDQQELLNVHQRKIDLLIGARVAQIYQNLEADLKVIRDRKQKIATIIKMPALR
jgi:phosphosulfolactate synthase (CoM biosynthesis protein A)